MDGRRPLFDALTRNALSLVGSALTTASAAFFLVLLGLDLTGCTHGPYFGIVACVIIPGFFLLGFLIIPTGITLERRRARKAAGGAAATPLPVIDLKVRRTRDMVLGFLGLTGINLALFGIATYKGAEAMETTKFCGTTCHNVMQPEATTHARSAHAGVRCVACHIGPGGTWFVFVSHTGGIDPSGLLPLADGRRVGVGMSAVRSCARRPRWRRICACCDRSAGRLPVKDAAPASLQHNT